MRHKASFRFTIGVVLAIGLLWFLFRGTAWADVFEAIRGVNPWWISVAVGATFLTQVLRVFRWGCIVRATHPVSFRSMFSATQIAFLVNITIPARLGELVRAYTLSRLEKISFPTSAALVALDRLYDVLALIVFFLVSLLSFPLGRDVEFSAATFHTAEPIILSSAYLRPAVLGLIVLFLAAAATFVFLFLKQDLVVKISNATLGRISPGLGRKINGMFLEFAEGMHIFRSATDLGKCFLYSLMTWAASALAIACILTAFGIPFPWYAPIFILCVTAVFIVFPLTPGMVGQYHFPVMACLIMAVPSVPVPAAKAVALITHLVGFLPLVVVGVYCLIREGITVSDLRNQVSQQTGTK